MLSGGLSSPLLIKVKPFDNATLLNELVTLTSQEIHSFIDKHIMGCNPFDYDANYSGFGINYYPKITVEGEGPVMGLRFRAHEDRLVIMGFTDNHKKVGLKRSDAILKVFGKDITVSNSKEVFGLAADMQPGDPFEIEIFRGGQKLTFTGELIEKIQYHVFKVDENASKKQVKLRHAWIGEN